jgi:hypothetical protein
MTSTTLVFGDQPNDQCILGPDGQPSLGYRQNRGAQAPCGGTFASKDSTLDFITELVGVTDDPDCVNNGDCPVLGGFTWTDNFNGISDPMICFTTVPPPPTCSQTGTGGVPSFTEFFSDSPIDPSTGTGGITLVSVNGVPVPETPTATLLGSGLALLFFVKKRRA